MNAKNLISRAVKRVNGFTVQDLSTDLVELSERDLKRVVGGGDPCGGGTTTITGGTNTVVNGVLTNKGGTVTIKPCTCQVIAADYSITLTADSIGRFLDPFSP